MAKQVIVKNGQVQGNNGQALCITPNEPITGFEYFSGNTHVWNILNVPYEPKSIVLYRTTYNSYYEYANYVIRRTPTSDIKVLAGSGSGQTSYTNCATITYNSTTKALRIELISNGWSVPNFRDQWAYILM